MPSVAPVMRMVFIGSQSIGLRSAGHRSTGQEQSNQAGVDFDL